MSNTNSIPTGDTLESGCSPLPSDVMLPFMAAINQNAKRIMDQQKTYKDDTDRKYEAMKELIKDCEEKSTQLSLGNTLDRTGAAKDDDSTTQSIKGKARIQKVSGINIICDEKKLSWALSLWVSARICDDLTHFWGNSDITNRNSTFAVMLFGVQRRDGHLPYSTTLGKDLGTQARAIVGRLLWTARCSAPSASDYTSSIPRWLFALVPVVRNQFTSTESRIGSNSLMNLSSGNGGSDDDISNETPDSGSTRRSQPTIIDDYHDLVGYKAAWTKESEYFKAAVANGCRAVEKKKYRDNRRKVSRISEMDVASQHGRDRSLGEAQAKIAEGGKELRKELSSFLTDNRFNCRQQFCEAIGFMLYKFKLDGKSDANKDGFILDLPDLSEPEKDVFSCKENFVSVIPFAKTMEGNENDVHDTNLRKVQDMIRTFPNLIVTLKYPVKIVDSEGGSRRRNDENEDVPAWFTRTEAVSLISLSVVLLTEYTRSVHTRSFFASSKKSIQAVITLAMTVRALVLRSLKMDLDPFESYILGNVYFDETDVPMDMKSISTVLTFRKDESNISRLKKKLTISQKKYIEEEESKIVSTLEDEEQFNDDDAGEESFSFGIPTHAR